MNKLQCPFCGVYGTPVTGTGKHKQQVIYCPRCGNPMKDGNAPKKKKKARSEKA